jgi:hypothetical protein
MFAQHLADPFGNEVDYGVDDPLFVAVTATVVAVTTVSVPVPVAMAAMVVAVPIAVATPAKLHLVAPGEGFQSRQSVEDFTLLFRHGSPLVAVRSPGSAGRANDEISLRVSGTRSEITSVRSGRARGKRNEASHEEGGPVFAASSPEPGALATARVFRY